MTAHAELLGELYFNGVTDRSYYFEKACDQLQMGNR